MDLFTDNDVRRAIRCGGRIDVDGCGAILLPRMFGFCAGVVRALRLLQQHIAPRPRRGIFLLGPIIHNHTVNEAFERQGVRILGENAMDEVVELARPGDLVVIPAFGIPLDAETRLRRRLPACSILDTTCEDVKAVWRFVEESPPGGTVIIHGKPGHPETRATLSRARHQAARVVIITSPEETPLLCDCLDRNAWDAFPPGRITVNGEHPAQGKTLTLVNQTTMLHEETARIGEEIQACSRRTGTPCRIADSICRATQHRQDAAKELCARDLDCVLVVGGFSSSNTTQLWRLARLTHAAYFIADADALEVGHITHFVPGKGLRREENWLRGAHPTIGVLAGTSCPACDVGRVIRALETCLRERKEKEG